jgi:hypothetical protein
MKKKLIAIAIAAAVAAPLAAQAAVEMSGDARVRYYTNDVTTHAMAPAKDGMKGALTDSRVGLNITATDGDVAMAKVRLEVQGNSGDVHGDSTDSIYVDTASLAANVGAGVTVTAGKIVSTWGHELYISDSSGDKVDIAKKMGDMKFGLTFTKVNEAGIAASADDKGDTSKTSLYFIMGKMGGIRHDATDTAGVKKATTALYGGAPLGGGWGLGFEYASLSGTSNTGSGLLLAAMGKAAGADLTVGYAKATDNFKTSDNFLKFVGTGKQAGSIFAQLGAGAADTSMASLFAVASMPAGPVNLEAGLASVSYDAGATQKNTVLSLRANYDLSKSSKIVGEYGNFSGDLVKASVMGARIETKF